MIDINDLVRKGLAHHDSVHKKSEKTKTKHYRVGSVGAVGADNKIYGVCHRISHARFLGYDKPIEESQKILFKGGEVTEFFWDMILAPVFDGQVQTGSYLQHKFEDISIMGHPDRILADKDGNPKQLIEIKGIFGQSTAIQVYFKKLPKVENLLQSALYCMMLDLPGSLCYTSFSWIKLDEFDQDRYKQRHILPFVMIFGLKWDDGRLFYKEESSDTWIQTIFTKESILDYYRLLHEMANTEILGPRPSHADVNGKAPYYNACNLCPFKRQCDTYDKTNDYNKWIKGVKRVCTKAESKE